MMKMINMRGLIVKGIAGFYYVKSGESVYRCKARGVFKQRDIKPAVGDEVIIEIIPDNEDSLITEIITPRNKFIRPFIANVDCFVIVTAAAEPWPVMPVIDRLLVMAEKNHTDIVLCINKCDLVRGEKNKNRRAAESVRLLREIYEPLYPVVCTDCRSGAGIDEIKTLIRGKKAALAGPSGSGKSSVLNRLKPEAEAETGNISEKSKRGKHTTRHSELFTIDESEGTMIFDTPGFTSFDILEADEEELQHLYPEIDRYSGSCRYKNCRHIAEPECSVLRALEEDKISISRYESYKQQLNEIKKSRQY